jgi:hypothetical protein
MKGASGNEHRLFRFNATLMTERVDEEALTQFKAAIAGSHRTSVDATERHTL